MSNFAVKPRFHVIFKQSYKPLKCWVAARLLPTAMPHLNAGLKATHIELRAAGKCCLDGKDYEFQDIRVYVDMAQEAAS
jgi:hypothetical protein